MAEKAEHQRIKAEIRELDAELDEKRRKLEADARKRDHDRIKAEWKRMEENGLSTDPLALYLFNDAVKRTEELQEEFIKSLYHE